MGTVEEFVLQDYASDLFRLVKAQSGLNPAIWGHMGKLGCCNFVERLLSEELYVV